jgi:N-methylhydantoinase A
VFRIGVDIGGTFTDFAIWEREDQGYRQITAYKVPSSRPDYAQAVIDGISHLAAAYGIGAEDEVLVVHGTTVSTNAVIERSEPPVALITSEGFRDILEIGRLRLDKPIDLFNRRPSPLVSRDLVFAVGGRMRADGTEDCPLDEASVRRAIEEIRARDVSAAGICLLHAHRYAGHEQRVLAMFGELAPEVDVATSHEVWPQQAEYERATLTLLNVYVRRLMDGYIGRIEAFLKSVLPKARLFVMKSNGGMMSGEEARRLPVHTLLSGPAAGVTAAGVLSRQVEADSVMTMDMGGTSTDVSLVRSGVASTTAQAAVGDFPLALPVTAIEALGAGGGSIVWLDENVMKVGPRSAGSAPGPACYGAGGARPTLTDAYLVCGYLSERGLLGGRLPLDRALAEAAFEPLAGSIGSSTIATAESSVSVATSNMLAKVLPFLARQGVEASDLTLMIFGGAGGIHGPLLAAELGIRRILVPRLPSVFCAFGCLVADLVHDSVRSVRGHTFDHESLRAAFAELAEVGRKWLEGQARADQIVARETASIAEMRYAAQSFTVPVDISEALRHPKALDRSHAAFHAEHERLFGHADPTATIAINELRVRTAGVQAKPGTELPERCGPAAVEATERRTLRFGGQAHEGCAVWSRDALMPGWSGTGPAIIEQDVATILVPPGFKAKVAPLGDLWLTMED